MKGVKLALSTYEAPSPQPVTNPLLTATGVSMVYPARRGSTTALENLNCTLDEAEFLSILGPSGCGKSTFLRLAAGLLQPTSGELTFRGRPIQGPGRDTGIVFQQPTLLPWATAIKNVMLPSENLGLDRKDSLARAHELLRLVGLSAYKDLYPGEMSGGMCQRVGIARGLAHRPSLLLMDEPFAALDAMTREHMMVELQRIWQVQRCSVIFITHSIPEAVFLSDRIVVMGARPGRVVRDINVDIPRPRTLATMSDSRFVSLTRDLRELFTDLVKIG
ncbi:ABC transporter ATP-binding protein [Bradyrhizobium uaiense]|uniref:ABC transporter ATP-binding protein n=1 Tax=Bradyrhizobium uaiense TaxID=2594946 RepID=A0A6P1BIP4_9BRAD|nr:ABC transporter ATP-binding protein [Bradyrhizobium uaiense]NEU98337.1 ABC transporter ATP-binding protein [Bradyrhizobium uaiense]